MAIHFVTSALVWRELWLPVTNFWACAQDSVCKQTSPRHRFKNLHKVFTHNHQNLSSSVHTKDGNMQVLVNWHLWISYMSSKHSTHDDYIFLSDELIYCWRTNNQVTYARITCKLIRIHSQILLDVQIISTNSRETQSQGKTLSYCPCSLHRKGIWLMGVENSPRTALLAIISITKNWGVKALPCWSA